MGGRGCERSICLIEGPGGGQDATEEETPEELVVLLAHTVPQPRAVVVVLPHTATTLFACSSRNKTTVVIT